MIACPRCGDVLSDPEDLARHMAGHRAPLIADDFESIRAAMTPKVGEAIGEPRQQQGETVHVHLATGGFVDGPKTWEAIVRIMAGTLAPNRFIAKLAEITLTPLEVVSADLQKLLSEPIDHPGVVEGMRRRLGTFSIPEWIVNDDPGKALTMLADIVVLRCEHIWHHQHFLYTGMSRHFGIVPVGQEPPRYWALYAANGGFERWE